MYLCRSQNKNNIRRWFLQRFQKSIKRSYGKHMNLVYDINLIFPCRRRIGNLFHNLSDIVHTIIGCSINLDYIHGCSCGNGLTGLTFSARTSIHRVLTVHRLGKDLGNSGLTCSSCSTEQVGMTDPVSPDLVFQGRYYMLLSLYIFKYCGTKFSVKSCI